jgi:hypothetical protein
MSEQEYIKVIDHFMADPDYSLIFYRVAFDQFNKNFDDNKRVAIVSFPSIISLKNWLETGIIGNNKFNIIFAPFQLILDNNIIQGKHKSTILTLSKMQNALCIVIECSSDTKNEAYHCSCLGLNKITDKSALDGVVEKLPIHAKNLYIL